MGGGKGAIDHYVTPIKAGRVIIELGGTVEFEEVIYLRHSDFSALITTPPNVGHLMLIFFR